MNFKRLSALFLTLALVGALTACKNTADTPSEPLPSQPTSNQPSADPDPSQTPSAPVDTRTSVKLAAVPGPAAVSVTKLLADSADGTSIHNYRYTEIPAQKTLADSLSDGTIDIAVIPSNVALQLYNQTNAGIKILALGAIGGFQILEGSGGTSIREIQDLAHQTVYVAGEGTLSEYALRYLLAQNGLTPDEDVTLIFSDTEDVVDQLTAGNATIALLPTPDSANAIVKSNGKVRAAIDLTTAWESLDNGSGLVSTAVVAHTQFISDHRDAVNLFLGEYAASIDYVTGQPDEAAALMVDLGLAASAQAAKESISPSHLSCLIGSEMAPAISDFFMALYEVDPTSVGGPLPDDAIYYIP